MVIIDNSYTPLNDVLRGRKPKFKVTKDGKQYIYKYGAINNEIWAELIAEQLGLQAGINMAHYELASCKNTIGVLTPLFLQPSELIVSSDNLKLNMQRICDENNININLSANTIANIVTAASLYDDRVDLEALTLDLMLRWTFYGMIMESDKNDTNIGLIKGKNALSLTPDYDNSSMACLNKNTAQLIDSLKNGYTIYSMTDSIKTNLKISETDTGFFLQDFESFTKNYPEQCDYCRERLSKIDIDIAFEIVETINQTKIPWEVKYWVSKAITTRFQDMQNIYIKNKNNRQPKSEVPIQKKIKS